LALHVLFPHVCMLKNYSLQEDGGDKVEY